MADEAAFAQCLMLKDEWATLRGMTLETSFVRGQQRDTTALHRLRQTGPAAFDRTPDVRIVTIGAAHFSFEYWVTMRQFKFGANFEMALEASVR